MADKVELVNYPGRAKSDVWAHFAFKKDPKTDKIDTSKAVCRLCHKSYINNGK